MSDIAYTTFYAEPKKITSDVFVSLFSEPQLVKYSLDENGKLKKIYKATDNSSFSPEEYVGYDDTKFTKEFESETGRIYNSLASENYMYNNNSKVFIIPNDGVEEHYSVGRYNQLGTDVSNLNVTLYDSDENFYIGAAVIKTAVSESSNVTMSVETLGDESLAIIESVIHVRTDDDEFVPAYIAYHKGKEVTLIAKNFDALTDIMVAVNVQGEKDTIKFSELNPGDLIMYHLNDKGEVNGFEVLFRCNNLDDSPKEINMQQGVGYVSVFQSYAGRATAYIPGRYFVLENLPTRMFNLTGSTDSRNVYEFDMDTKEVRILESVGSVEDTDYLFVKTRRTTIRDVVVYKNYD